MRVTASDGHAESEPFMRPTVVGNREPRISGLMIQPAGQITAAGPITAVATGADPDGDALSFNYTWTVNDETADERGPVFPGDRLKRGDMLQVSVVASDEQSESEPIASPPIEVMNAAPVIRSQPVLTSADTAFAYHVAADDADGDRLRYGLGERPRWHDGARGERRRRLDAARGPGRARTRSRSGSRMRRAPARRSASSCRSACPRRPIPRPPCPPPRRPAESESEEAVEE